REVIAIPAHRMHDWIVGGREKAPRKEKETKNETLDSDDHAGGGWSFRAIGRDRDRTARPGFFHAGQAGGEDGEEAQEEQEVDHHAGCCSRGKDRCARKEVSCEL